MNKQETTLEEAAENHLQKWRLLNNIHLSNILHAERCKNDFIAGAKWQQEKSYSEEEAIDLIQFLSMNEEFNGYCSVSKETAKHFLKQFKTITLMKNIHIIPTDKPSRVYKHLGRELKYTVRYFEQKGLLCINQNIYITNDEKIKEGDWFYIPNQMIGYEHISNEWSNDLDTVYAKKIILTTDQDLIKDGVQAIDDEFLEWFVKNPSCEEVEVEEFEPIYGHQNNSNSVLYKTIIPKEEPNMISDWLEQNRNPEIDKQVDEEAKKLQKQYLINMMKQDEELGLYDEQLRKQFSANIEGSKEFNEMCKEEPKERLKKILGTKHPKQEINLEEVFNDDKKANIKKFIDEIIKPSQPNDKLKQAFEKYSEYLEDYENKNTYEHGFKDGARCQQAISYSEEEVIAFGEFIFKHTLLVNVKGVEAIFEQFKKK